MIDHFLIQHGMSHPDLWLMWVSILYVPSSLSVLIYILTLIPRRKNVKY